MYGILELRLLTYRQSPRRGAVANPVKTEYECQSQKNDHHPGKDGDSSEEFLF